MQAVFHFSKNNVNITADSLEWGTKHKVTVPLNEVVAVHPGDPNATTSSGSVTVHYIKHKSNHKLRCALVTFTGETTVCTEFVKELQEKSSLVSTHPHRLLVFINPISGNSHGQRIFETKAAPLFALAGIETDTKVTERANHSRDVLMSYNLSQVDGVVAVGGDGVYFECVNGLVLRAQKEAGVDENNSEMELRPTALPLGIIPAGTGNGVVKSCVGCLDVETSVLAIILGCRRKYNIMAVFNGGKLLSYSGLLVAHGIFSDMIDYTESHRKYGKGRYLRSVAKVIWNNNPRILDAEISYLPDTDHPQVDDAGSRESSDWCTIRGDYTNITQFGYNIASEIGGQFETSTASLPLMTQKFCSRTQGFRFVYRLMKQKNWDDMDFVKMFNVKAVKVRMLSNVADSSLEGATAAPPTTNDLTKILDIDGEVISFDGSEFEIRSHIGVMELYSSLPYK
ncbi:hypothetical protein ScPMuIL_006517 [Solemya velum]